MSALAAFLIGLISGVFIVAKSTERVHDKSIKSGYIKDSDYNHYRVTPLVSEDKEMK